MMDENDPLPFSGGRANRTRSSGRKFLLLLLLFLVAAVGGLLLFLTETEDEEPPPVVEIPDPPIVASEEIKSPPDEPGGLEIAHQDKLIYERLTPADATVSNEDALDEVMMGLVAEEPLADFSAADSGKDSAKPAAPSVSAEDSSEPTILPDSVGDSAEPAAASIKTETNEFEPSATPSTELKSSGDYVVQLAAFTRNADANAALEQTALKFSDAVGKNMLFIQRADLGDGGVWHRLRIGYFATRLEAAEVCAKFQSLGQNCLVATR